MSKRVPAPLERLTALGLALPAPPRPAGDYLPYRLAGSLLVTAGQLPMREGRLAYTGAVGRDLTAEEGAEAAQLALLNALAIVDGAVGLDRVRQVVRLGVFVRSAPGFDRQPRVADGASRLLAGVFGEEGRHARVAVGCNELPLGAPVEIELWVEVAPAG